MSTARALRTVVIAAHLALAGCGGECNDMLCNDGVEVQLVDSLDAALEYSVTLRADDVEIVCDYGSTDFCRQHRVAIQTVNGRITGFILERLQPGHLSFAFSERGKVLLEAAVSLEYAAWEPNGAGCPPSCTRAFVAH